MKRVLWLVHAAAFVVFSLPLASMPGGLASCAGKGMGLMLFHIWSSRRLIALGNLQRALQRGAVSLKSTPYGLIRENFQNLSRSFIELIKIFYGMGGGLLKGVSVEGLENFKRASEKGKGVIFLTGHCGNWELLALVLGLNTGRIGVIARPLNNIFLNSLLERARAKSGNFLIYKKGALKNIISTLRAGGNVGILIDQAVVPEEGFLTDFLGSPAWTTKMPSLMAKKTGAPILPVFIRRTAMGHELKIHPEVELGDDDVENTKKLSGYIEEYIRENPSEWLWMHRRWKRAAEI